jgi:putative MATE family efflux protein
MIKRLDLGKEAILPLILKMSWPSIIAMTAMSLYNFIDTFWLARLSPEALAALTVCFPIQIIFAAVGVGTGIGAGSYSARMFGAGNDFRAKKTAGQIFSLSLIFGLIMIISVLCFGNAILITFGAFREIMPLCHDYLYIIVFSSPFLFFSMMSNNMLRSEGRPLLSMYVVLITSVISAVLDPFLIFGIGPFPRLGIRGAAIAAVAAQIFGSIFSLYFMQLKSSKYELRWSYTIPDIQIIRSIYSTGLPSIVINLVASLVLVIYNHVLAHFGSQAIAALGICFRITGLATMVIFGIGFGLMPVVGFSAGARLYRRLKDSVFTTLKVSLIFALGATLFLEIYASEIVSLFSRDPSLIALSTLALRIHVLALVLTAPIIILINMFMGLGKGTLAMFLLFFRDSVVFIPLLLILPLFFGITGAWMALPLANLFALILIIYWTTKELQRL